MSDNASETVTSIVTPEEQLVDDLQFKIRPSRWYNCKRLVGRTLAGVLLVPGLPMIGTLIVLVRTTSQGPGIYRQCRVGKNGRLFWLYKIRTMRYDAEARTGPVWSKPGDPRVTALGRWLRKLHMDEFPQLFNVLRGEMTLIGPRPERPEIIEMLADEVPGYLDRLSVQPGITGLAQINLPPDTDIDSVRRKLVLDKDYITQATPWMDMRILMCTLCRVVGIPGAAAMRMFLLQRSVNLPQDEKPAAETSREPHPDRVAAEHVRYQEPGGNGEEHAGDEHKKQAPRDPRRLRLAAAVSRFGL